jgi:ribonuclease D
MNYTFFQTLESIDVLTTHLRKTVGPTTAKRNRYIFLDCEGRDLGAQNGKLGLIQIGIGDAVYLVDVVTLPEAVGKLKSFLQNPSLLKYVWDGRSDYSELRHGHDVTLRGLVDLQLAYIRTQAQTSKTKRLSGMMQAAEALHVAESEVLSQIRSGISCKLLD